MANTRRAAAELLRAASAVLGAERAGQLRDALAERSAQFLRVGEADRGIQAGGAAIVGTPLPLQNART